MKTVGLWDLLNLMWWHHQHEHLSCIGFACMHGSSLDSGFVSMAPHRTLVLRPWGPHSIFYSPWQSWLTSWCSAVCGGLGRVWGDSDPSFGPCGHGIFASTIDIWGMPQHFLVQCSLLEALENFTELLYLIIWSQFTKSLARISLI